MCLKRWYTLGLAGLLSLAGVGSANIGGTATRLPPVPEGEPVATAPPPTPTPELQTFTAGGHVLGFGPQYLLTAGNSHALKVEFLNTRGVTPQSDAPNQAGSAERTLQDLQGVRREQKAPPLTQVRYPNLWEGIDLSYHAVPGGIAESLYQLQPGADINQVRLRYNRPLSLNADGSLSLHFDTGTLTESAPIAWQERDGQRQAVSVAFVQHNERELGFALGEYDRGFPLWIDPTLSWNTFLGSSNEDKSINLILDTNGNVYVVGSSSATWGNPLRAHSGGDCGDAQHHIPCPDIVIAKLNPEGTLLWNTFLGSSSRDLGINLFIDSANNVYVTGESWSTWGSPLRPHGGGLCGHPSATYSCQDIMVAKLNPSGALLWHTFLGSSSEDTTSGIAAVDSADNLYVVGSSSATWGTPLRPHAGGDCAYAPSYTDPCSDIMVAKLNPSGVLLWHTFLGSSSEDVGFILQLDTAENLYLSGSSSSTWGNPVRAHAGNNGCGSGSAIDSYVCGDIVVAKLNPSGALQWHTFLGSPAIDFGANFILDGIGNIYLTGQSQATWGNPIRAHGGGNCGSAQYYIPCSDIFVAKLNSSGSLLWNTFLGSSTEDYGGTLALDSVGNLYVSGSSGSTWGNPLHAHAGGICGIAPIVSACIDIVVAKLNPEGALLWNTFLGSSSEDWGGGLFVDDTNSLYLTGSGNATWGNPQRAHSGGVCGTAPSKHPCSDIVVMKLDSAGTLLWNTFLGSSYSDDHPTGFFVDSTGNFYGSGESSATWGNPLRTYSTGTCDAFSRTYPCPDIVVAKLGTNGSALNESDLSGKAYLWGTNIPVCAMVLANGKSQFSCDGQGNFALTAVPLDSQQEITLYSWAEGFVPYKFVFTPDSATEEVDVAMTVSPCQGPSGGTTTQHSSLPQVDLSGKVFLAGTTTPVCAMVLANGKSQFSCGGDGHYVLDDVPLDGNGQVTLYTWAEGFFPYKAVLAPFSIVETRDVPMTVASCPH